MNNLFKTLSLMVVLFSMTLNAQEKKPTLMILPSDAWCEARYFTTNYTDIDGTKVSVPDYQKAFKEDSELGMTISKIGQLLTSKGYSLKDAEQNIKSISTRASEDNMTLSKTSASTLAESPLDMIKKRAKMDILIQLWWKVNRDAGGRSVSFTLEAFDSYTNKRIATATGTGKSSQESVPVLLENAVKSKIKDFDKQMTAYYKELHKQGREVLLTIKRWDSWENDLETEYDGEELLDCIQSWLRKHTLNGNFNLTDATENFAQFEQVMIPLNNKDNGALDARSFAVELRNYLRDEYDIVSKVMTRGLGEAIIVLGEK